MTRIRIVVAALVAAVFAAPTAFAQPPDVHASTAPATAKQDLRMPDRRAPAQPASAAKDYSKNAVSGDFAPAVNRPAPVTVAHTGGGDGIETLPFVLFVSGALMLGGAAGASIGSRRTVARPAS
jgi:hypothetical protein